MLIVPVVGFALQPATSFADSGTLDCNNLPGGLQYYLTTAAAGDSFSLSGTCIGNFTINKSMTLQGGTLQGHGSAPVLTIAPGSGSVTIQSTTITGGTGINGDNGIPVLSISGKPAGPGGIDIKNGNVTLQYSTVSGNSGGNGGDGSSVSNLTGGNGGRGGTGGILVESGTVTLNGDVISGNAGGHGGNGFGPAASPGNGGDSGANGIQVNSGSVTIVSTSIKNNISPYGVGSWIADGGDSVISPGSGGRGSAGGIAVGGGTVNVIDSTISGNGGGAGGSSGAYTLTPGYGTPGTGGPGGMLVGAGSLNLYNSTVSGNLAGYGGGGVFVGQPIGFSGDGAGTVVGGSLTLTYTTVAGDTSRAGFVGDAYAGIPEVYGTAGVDGLGNRGGFISLKASILQGDQGETSCAGTITNNGYNVFGTFLGSPAYQACDLTDLSDINQFTDATHKLNLGTLGDTVNSTGVVPLNAGSIAIGRVPASVCQAGLPGPSGSGFPNPNGSGDLIVHDQRDVGRTGPCDAGSFQTLTTPSVKLRSFDDTGVSNTDGITSNNRPGFLGNFVAPGGFPVTLYMDGQRLGTTTTSSSFYGFFFRAPAVIADGTHTISATVTDPDNGLTTPMSTASSFVVVTTHPTITLAPANQSISSDGYYSPDTGSTTLSVNAGASAVDALTGLSCTEADGTSVLSLPTGDTSLGGTFSLPGGAHSITCSATDVAGNSGTFTRTLNVRVATTTTVTSSLASSVYGNSVTFTASVSSSGGTPTGTVAFSTAAGTISGCGAQALDTTGAATCTTSLLGAGADQTVTATYGARGAFTGSSGTTSQSVTRAALSVTGVEATRIYGDSNPAFSVTYDGFVNGEGSSALGGTLSFSTVAVPTSSAGSYAVTPGGLTSSNYSITFNASTLSVTPAALTVTADDKSRAYGGGNPTLTATYSGFKNNETLTTSDVTGSPALQTAAGITSDVGTYPITAALGTLASTNYTFSLNPGTLTVTPAQLTVTAPNPSVQYTDPLSALLPTITGYMGNDTATALTTGPSCATTAVTSSFANAAGTTTTTAGVNSPVGSYGITCSGGQAVNYVFSYTAGAVTVNQEDATVEMSAAPNAQIVGSGPITFSATVRDSAASGYTGSNPESSTGTIGDVTRAYVEFDIYNAASCLSGQPLASPVVPVTATGTQGVGTATYSLPSPATEASYCVVPRIAGATAGSANPYYTAPAGSLTGIAFYQNTGQFATGGGWIADSNSSTGQGALSFNARYTKQGGAKGQMAYSWQGMYNGQLANFSITSNAISTLTFSGTTSPITATLQGKCAESIVSVTTGQQLYSQGNLTFTATAKDGDYGQPQNIPSDGFSLSVFNRSNQAIKQVSATPLGGGNLVVHNS